MNRDAQQAIEKGSGPVDVGTTEEAKSVPLGSPG
jgi:hypothetical protein